MAMRLRRKPRDVVVGDLAPVIEGLSWGERFDLGGTAPIRRRPWPFRRERRVWELSRPAVLRGVLVHNGNIRYTGPSCDAMFTFVGSGISIQGLHVEMSPARIGFMVQPDASLDAVEMTSAMED